MFLIMRKVLINEKHMKKAAVPLLLMLIFLLLLSLNVVSAITGNVENSRHVLKLDPGEIVERSFTVKNLENQDVGVKLDVEGNLKDNIRILQEEFIVEAGKDKKVKFYVSAQDSGTLDAKINVVFSSLDGKQNLPLDVVVIVNVGNQAFDADDWESQKREPFSFNFDFDWNFNVKCVALLSTTLLLVVFLVLILLMNRKS